MSSSLTKRKPQPQKENLNRLSNSKILNAYSNTNLNKINCSDFSQPYLSTNFQQKLKTNTKKTARLKTGRKHQMSVEFILSSKIKEPYSVRNLHPEAKIKQKKKKKEKSSNQSSKFIIPIGQFSKSNSLIVFSEKDSTMGANLFNKDKNPFFSQKYSQSQAAIIIQKTWRGYLTRKLLDQYIADQQSKLNSVIKRIRSKDESFEINEHQAQELHFSEFSSINQGTTNINDLRKQGPQNDEYSTNAKYYPLFTSSQQFSKENGKCQSPVQYKSFFKSHKTEVEHATCDVLEPSKTLPKPTKKALSIHSSLYNFSLSDSSNSASSPEALDQPLSDKLSKVSEHIQSCFKACKKQLKELLQFNFFDLQEMILRNTKIKQIYEGSQIFLHDVCNQLTAILEDMQDITRNGFQASSHSSSHKNQPKSELFTIQMDQNQPQLPSNYFGYRQGQLKLQSYLNDLIQEYNQNRSETSQLQFLCEILKVNSERGVKNIIERCLIQFTVEIITENIPLQQLNRHIYKPTLGVSRQEQFLRKWVEQLGKWDMGTIHEVTQAMQSSSFINCDHSRSFTHEKNQ